MGLRWDETQGDALGWYVVPLRGGWICDGAQTQGVALGWYVVPLRGWPIMPHQHQSATVSPTCRAGQTLASGTSNP